MRVVVYMRDGRTCYRIKGRGILRRLVNDEPWNEENGVKVERGTWNPQTGEYVWIVVFVRFLAKGSISHVEQDTGQVGGLGEAA